MAPRLDGNLINGQLDTPAPAARQATLLRRSDLDKALPYVRSLLGFLLLMYGALSTIDGVRVDCGPTCLLIWQGFPLWQVAGVLVAFGLSIGQWFTSDRYISVYYVLLLIDVRYTQWWTDDFATPLMLHNARTLDPRVASGLALVVSYALAYGVARFAELLLFGRRK